ncbi:unnamed protein product [Vitrella brassicaformis CCMP3155]|uniref:Peptidase S74 domain-containing protein n=3 Tax=Vitrella brassicaformis TaxID=1169539 RepID=A0A0G4EX34_VITBC|nr:unnamed protein product [Vitrella brassicaformis CCMP3155]|mmetsp:Transcript_51065/g.128139  ORF Transcript_51065/g.128139 Transcript_51065/m.128139 type:complete len:310 (+) Transcript_51065:203-1132(+)|eukprot:CEM02649.1 unnamed protein product [Vitrella brassicaformis CCMP3155]
MLAASQLCQLFVLVASSCWARRAAANPPQLFPFPPPSEKIDELSKPTGGNVPPTKEGLIGAPAVNNSTGAALRQYATFQCGDDPSLGAADLQADNALLQGYGMLGCGTDFPLYEIYAGGLFSQFYGALSDGRYKTRVSKETAQGGMAAMEAIKKIDFYSFQWKNDDGRTQDETHRGRRIPYAGQRQFGVLAEEVRSVWPEAVFESSVDRGHDNKALYVNLPTVLYKTIHATQHVAERIEAQESQAADVQAAISEMRQELAELTRDVRDMKALATAVLIDRYESNGRTDGSEPRLFDELQEYMARLARND